MVGVVELHRYAGVSGGHKVAVGCGGRQTISALHHRDRILETGVEIGRIDGNPFRAAIEALGEAARCRLALVWVPAIGQWMFGPPKAVVRAALSRMEPWVWQSEPAPGAVLEVADEKAVSLYQASRAASYLALSPRPPLAEGATLVLRAACLMDSALRTASSRPCIVIGHRGPRCSRVLRRARVRSVQSFWP